MNIGQFNTCQYINSEQVNEVNEYQLNSDSSIDCQNRSDTPDSSVFEGFSKKGEEIYVNKSRLDNFYRKSSSTRYDY